MARKATSKKTRKISPKETVLSHHPAAFLIGEHSGFFKYGICKDKINWGRIGYGNTPSAAWKHALLWHKFWMKNEFLKKLETEWTN